MVRKRHRYIRARGKRPRPKAPAPKTGWVIADLARIAGVSVRKVRYYVELHLIQPSEFRGTATRYQRRELVRLLAIVRARAEEHLSLAEIKHRLDSGSQQEFETWLANGPLPPAAAEALGFAVDRATGAGLAASGNDTSAPSPSVLQLARGSVETWQRVRLLPGLELLLNSDATLAVRRAAQSICDEYLGK